ncbi:MAG: keto-deoxy-phosphogluconate aldolase, partial [Acetobacteraceae bacterium]|nr:keto-deoxy-phosphogluconate aldolase [Acetobacteraceae bacterium]
PTGGVNEANVRAYLALPNVVAVGGSWMAPAADVEARNWEAITNRAKRAMELVGT